MHIIELLTWGNDGAAMKIWHISKDALKDVGIPIIIEDVFVVPDYQAYINPHLLDISQAFKLKYTKTQWIFD